MRTSTFTFSDRLALVPMELVPVLRWSVPALLLLSLAGGAGRWGYSLQAAWLNGINFSAAYTGALIAGAVITPLLLPWIPGRAFSIKGALTGLFWALLFVLIVERFVPGFSHASIWRHLSWFLSLPAISAFFAMNFTGSTTFTSLSGVKKEMRFALPFQIAGGAGGFLLWCAAHFLKGAI